jgi:hypothetical protein
MAIEEIQWLASGPAATAGTSAPLPRFRTPGNCDPVSRHAFGRQALRQVNDQFRY